MKRHLIFISGLIFIAMTCFSGGAEGARGVIEAFSMARADFEEKIKLDFPDEGEGRHWRQIKNYSIGVVENDSDVVVVFIPRRGGGGDSLIGGGGEYYVDKKTLVIKRFVGYE